VTIGLTGLPIMENDEMRSSQTSMYWASLLSLAGVALLFVAGFGGVRHALLANLVLLVGIAWSFGYVTLAVGHLNILSMSFTVTLIGIGIDYGVYYVSRYLEVRRHEPDCHAALVATTTAVGPAILTGAITTAIAFFAAGLTSFPGVAELGQIAGGGILLCAAAELLVLPAVLKIVDRSGLGFRLPEPLPVERWINPLLRAPRVLLLVAMVATGALSIGTDKLWYDHNLLNLQAADLESVELERKLLAETDQNTWYALSIADDEAELLERAKAFRELPSVKRTEEIVQLFPADQAAKQPAIARIHAALADLPERPSLVPVDKPDRLGRSLGDIQELLASTPDGARGVKTLSRARDALRRLSPEECRSRLREFQQNMAGELLSRLHALQGISNPKAISLADLPPGMVDRFVGRHGKHLLRIYGKGNIWDMVGLEKFVREVRSVDPSATGNPLQAYEASLEMQSSYIQSAIYAMAVIVVVLYLDLRSVSMAVLALAPLGLGVLQTFGLMGWLGIPLNPANTIALPLILGIGVDYGVHIIHEFRERTGPYRMSHATAVAVLVDALTTIVGFGSLMIASHEGLRSLGRVLTIGVSCCLFSSMVVLPAALAWRTRNRTTPEDEEIQRHASSRVVRRDPPDGLPALSPAAAFRESPAPAR
jgi:hopanoid biosynthesis associated RND transporter like protein HpnN